MKKSWTLFLIACSVGLLACQIQYLIMGQPSSATDVPAKSRSTATVSANSTVPASVQPTLFPGSSQTTIITAKEDLTLRSAPSSVAPSAGQLPKETSAQVIARTPANDWFQIGMFYGLTMLQGWVPANQVTVDGPLDNIPVVQPSVLPSSSAKSVIPTPSRQTYPSSSQPTAPMPTRKTYP